MASPHQSRDVSAPRIECGSLLCIKRVTLIDADDAGARARDVTENSFDDLKGAALRYMQLCDAKPGRPADMQEIIRQARGDRLLPGEGALDLRGLLRALPADLPISVEIPCAQPMPPLERARKALQATWRLAC